MSWFKKKSKEVPNEEEVNPWQEKYEELEIEYKDLKSSRAFDIREASLQTQRQCADTIEKWEKEVVYWKEKALNFKKFHQ